jgi:hypothetical protein
MRVQSAAEYSIEYYTNAIMQLKEASNKIFQEGIQARYELAEFNKKLEELRQCNKKKDIITKDKVDVIV